MSNKVIGNLIAVVFILLVAFSATAVAVTEDFAAFGSKRELNVCACDFKEESLAVQNTGSVTSTYIIEPIGVASEWTDVAPATFYLEPGEAKELKQFIKIPCSARGEYDLNTSVRTIFDLEKVIGQKLIVQNCPNVQIIPLFSGVQSECPCTPVQYRFDVVNTGNHIETYELSVEPFSDAISLSTPVLILEPGEKQSVDVFINLACGEYGERIFTFNAKAVGTQILGQTDFNLNIDKCYDYNIDLASEYDTCQGVPNIIRFQLQNNADIANTYALDVQGIDWAYPENSTLNAWGKEIVDGNIVLFPPNAEQEESYTFTLHSLSARGLEERFYDVTVTDTRCHDYVYEESAIDMIACEQADSFLTMANPGTRATTYAVSLDAPEWIVLNDDALMLAPGNSSKVGFSMSVPCDATGDYPFSVYTTIEETNQTYVEEKTISVHTKEEAYLVDMSIPEMDIGYEGGDFEAKITNVGYRSATYSLYVEASDWVTIDKTQVTLAPGESSTLIISAYPTEENVVKDIYAAKLVAQVSEEKLEYAAGFTVALAQESLLSQYWWVLVIVGGLLLLVIIIVVLLALSSRKRKALPEKKEEQKKPITIDRNEYAKSRAEKKASVWPWVLGIIILLALAGGAYYTFIALSDIGFGDGNETIEEPITDDDLAALEQESAEAAEVLEEPAVEDMPVEVVQAEVPEEAPEVAPEVTRDEVPAEQVIAEPSVPDVLTNENFAESLITIDRSGIGGSGNVFELTNETQIVLPVTVLNPSDRKAKLDLSVGEGSWISFDRKTLAIPANSSDTVTMTITPDLAALETSDYAAQMTASLEGKKISYNETLEFVLTKKKAFMDTPWPWVIVGVVALLLLILVISALSRMEKRPKTAELKPSKQVAREEKAAKKETKKELKKELKKEKGRSIVLPIVIVLILFAALAGIGYWAYQMQPEDAASAEAPVDAVEEPAAEAAEPAQESAPAETAAAAETTEPAKLTEEDIPESLVRIDRSAVPGEGNELVMEAEQYIVPVSIRNPTERKAIFGINTADESWIVFDTYKVIVPAESTGTVNMTILPDMETLKQNDYAVSVNVSLAGQRIDYEETLDFVVKSPKNGLSYWAYALIAIVLIALAIIITEIVRGSNTPGKKRASKRAELSDTNKDLSDINKELANMRKGINSKMKKMSK